MKRRNAFTLIEVLVVVGIIALLASILLPSLNKARTQTRRMACASNLHQVGLAMMSYLQDSHDHMPYVSMMPSISPAPLTTRNSIYLIDPLKRHLKGQEQALACPDDRPGFTERDAPNKGLSYFQSEKSSYQYRVTLAGLTPTEFGNPSAAGVLPWWHRRHEAQGNVTPGTVYFAQDYWNFHGMAGQPGARRYVYIDGHVSDYEN